MDVVALTTHDLILSKLAQASKRRSGHSTDHG